jgi:ubiquitin carboxyl-terminal hydrolase 7
MADKENARTQVKLVRMKKQALFADVKDLIADSLNVPVENMRFWYWAMRSNRTYRPTRPLTVEDENTRVEILTDYPQHPSHSPKNAPFTLDLFLETPVGLPYLLPIPKNSSYLMFFKFYDPATQSLSVRALLGLGFRASISI